MLRLSQRSGARRSLGSARFGTLSPRQPRPVAAPLWIQSARRQQPTLLIVKAPWTPIRTLATVPTPQDKEKESKVKKRVGRSASVWARIKKEARHFKVGFRLLWADTRISSRLLLRVMRGNELTRRERKQLLRTVADLFRIVPFAMFIIIPGAELLLPAAVYIFPNMLPSTFEHKHQKEEAARKQIKVKLELAKFLQDTVVEMNHVSKKEKKKKASSDNKKETEEEICIEVQDNFDTFMEKVRKGQQVSNTDILYFSKLFRDEFMLDSLSSQQLVYLCKYMNVSTLGTDRYLRFLLRNKIEALKNDDIAIQEEGIETLSVDELRHACLERGMPGYGVPEEELESNLGRWLQLSLDNEVPTSMLLLSRAFLIQQQMPVEKALQQTLSKISDEVVTDAKAVDESSKKAEEASKRDEGKEDTSKNEEVAAEPPVRGPEEPVTELVVKEVEEEHVEDEEDIELREAERRLERIRNEEELIAAERKAEEEKQRKKEQERKEREEREVLDEKKTVIDGDSDLREVEKELERESHRLLHPEDVEVNKEEIVDNEERVVMLESLREIIAVTAKSSAVSKEKLELAEMKAVEAVERKRLADKQAQSFLESEERAQKHLQEASSSRKSTKKTEEDVEVDEYSEEDEKLLRTTKRLERRLNAMIKDMETKITSLEDILGERLHLIDTDDDGFISVAELEIAVKAMKHPLSEATSKEIFELLDTDRDGRIHLEVLENYLRKEVSERKQQMTQEIERADDTLQSN